MILALIVIVNETGRSLLIFATNESPKMNRIKKKRSDTAKFIHPNLIFIYCSWYTVLIIYPSYGKELRCVLISLSVCEPVLTN